MSTATSGITTFNLYHLCKKTDPSYEIVSHGKTLKAAIANCSGGSDTWRHVRTEKRSYTHAALMNDIAAALPGTWTAEPNSYEHADCNWHVVRDDGLKLYVSMPSWSHRGKLEISLSIPSRNGRYVDVYEGGTRLATPKIGVSEEKSVEQIVKDIIRRLLPDAEKHYKAILARIAEYDASEAAQLDTYRQLCAVLRVEPRQQTPGDPRTSAYFGHGSFEVNAGGTASFKTHSVSPEKAIKIAEALQRLLAE